jgi:outer membrane immunogenic protein
VSVGWTAGAGAEYRLTNNLSLKVEYLHVALAGQTIRMLSPAPPSTPGVFANARFDPEDVNIVRAGINYRFDFLAPPH